MTFYVFFLHFAGDIIIHALKVLQGKKLQKKKSPYKSPKFFLRTKLFPHAVVNVAPICISAIILFLLTSILLKTTEKKKT